MGIITFRISVLHQLRMAILNSIITDPVEREKVLTNKSLGDTLSAVTSLISLLTLMMDSCLGKILCYVLQSQKWIMIGKRIFFLVLYIFHDIVGIRQLLRRSKETKEEKTLIDTLKKQCVSSTLMCLINK